MQAFFYARKLCSHKFGQSQIIIIKATGRKTDEK